MMAVVDATASVALPRADDTAVLGAQLAQQARAGDVYGLSGDLGSGKTTLARGFIQALVGPDCDVPSPTFTLVQTYDTPRGVVWHFDLYRMARPDDAVELGLEDALIDGICLIEWPQRLGPLWPSRGLMVVLDLAGTGRVARLAGGPAWQARVAGLARGRA
ncbi:MAG: tRNA (adenosine(37)-N6)-threonylcarbamoyltransferase complex ATPase subunit type 1 TsaE [Rhodospirillaceae bacterium]|nr:tRNA (adenosine(37)-N6)-threonylcarbamoyltransferase complex ATPase subunit type 1 TsaE [Rhodospirillaceae bacterium]